jgi:hypothetical protein
MAGVCNRPWRFETLIAGHVKQTAKEVKGNGPGTFGMPGFFIGPFS